MPVGRNAGDGESTRISARARALPVAVWTLAVVATIMFLRVAYDLMIPIVLAILISFALNPLVAWLERLRVPRLLAAAIVLLSVTALLGYGIYSLRDEATEVLDGIPRAAHQLRDSMDREGNDEGFFGKLQRAIAEVQKATTATAGAESREEPAQPAAPAQGSSGRSMLARGSAGLAYFLGNVVVIFFFVYFLLIGGVGFRNRLISAAGPRRRITAEILDEIHLQMQRFLVVRLITSTVVAIVTTIVLALMGVKQAAFWGIAAGVFNSIEYFGPIIVSGGLTIVGLMQFGDVFQALRLAAVALVITSLEGWLLTPPLMGRAARMNAITVFAGLLLWSWIWGIWGTILAVPMMASFKAICDHVEGLKPIGRLMGD